MKKLCLSQITSVAGGMFVLFVTSKDEWVENKKAKFTDDEPVVNVKRNDNPLDATEIETEVE